MKGKQAILNVMRRARRRFVPGAVVLAYHRVADLECDPFRLAVSPGNFVEQMDYLKSTFTIMRLSELGEALKNRKLPPRAIAITFDDGYVDMIENVHPNLRSTRIPATVFIPSALLGCDREFWWDALERVFHSNIRLPNRLDLYIGGSLHTWDTETEKGRLSTFWAVYWQIKRLHHEKRLEVLDDLEKWAGFETGFRPGYRPMNPSELISLVNEGWIEVGAHTKTHVSLATVNADEQRREIVEGRERLAGIVNRPVTSFAYPYGAVDDFTVKTASILKEEGFQVACTTMPGSVEAGDDMYQLKRLVVENSPIDAFKAKLELAFIS